MAQKVMYPGMVNSPETTITNGISESDTIIYVLDPTRVPTPPNLMTLGTGTNAETVKVLEMNDNAITVERGFQGVAKSWPAGTVIARNFTEYDYNALKENIEDLDASKETPAGAQAKADAAAGAVQAELAAHLAEIVTTPQANKILRLDANAKLPASITGDAATVAGKSVGNSSGQIPVSNSIVCTNLNADKVDGEDASTIKTNARALSSAKLVAEVNSSAPSNPTNGQVWYDSANHKFRGYANGAWV